jgi:sigma-B regulation protein RsbU (phosphoserine phosphatase)
MSLRKRIQVLLAFLMALPLAILFVESARHGHQTLVREMKKGSLQMATLQAAQMDLTFIPARRAAEGLARAVAAAPALDPEALRTLVRLTLDQVPDAYGFCVALEPGATPAGALAPYAFRDVFRAEGRIHERSLADPGYQYTRWPWFQAPMASGRGRWSEPYFDQGGGDALMITYSAPIRRQGRLVGVATVDLSLMDLARRLAGLHPGGDGTVYLVDRTGRILLHPQLPAQGDASSRVDPRLAAGLKALLAHPGTDTVELTDPVARRRSWVVEMPVASMAGDQGGRGWSVIVSWPMVRRVAPLIQLAERLALLFLGLGGGALLFLNRAFDDVITRPVRRLAGQARRYAQGDFSARRGPREEAQELEELGQAIQALGTALAEAREPAVPEPGGVQ